MVLLLGLHLALFIWLRQGIDPLGVLVTYPAAAIFVIVGLLLLRVGRPLGLSGLAQALPFLDMVYTFTASIVVANTLRYAPVHWIAAVGCVLLIAVTVCTTVRTLLNPARP